MKAKQKFAGVDQNFDFLKLSKANKIIYEKMIKLNSVEVNKIRTYEC